MNIQTVAQHAGVSIATVSRVINGTAVVSPETARRVREAIEALDFHPDTSARTLGSGKSGLYGLIISDITNPYFPELVKSFEDIAVEHGLDVLIANTDYDPARMELCVTRMLQRRVDGVAIMTSEMEDRLLTSFSSRSIPVTFMDTSRSVNGASTVRVDYLSGVRDGMEHLFELGHRRIAFLSGPMWFNSSRSRSDAYVSFMQEHGIPVEPHWVQEGDHRVAGGKVAMRRMLEGGAPPTAVFTSNDLTAIGAMAAIHEAGLRIPQDISIVGFDDIALSSYTRPALTTMRVSRRDLASMAFRSLHRVREQGDMERDGTGEPSDEKFVVRPALVVRQSTAPI